MIKGTQCELCNNRVEFNGTWRCTVASCNFFADLSYCDNWFYNQEACNTCGRSKDCPYQSNCYPLAYTEE